MNKIKLLPSIGGILFLITVLLSSLLLTSCDSNPVDNPIDIPDNSPDTYTPNGKAEAPYWDTTGKPVFSIAPGIYNDPIVISLSCDNPEYTIRYTIDNSMPDASSPVYSEPIPASYLEDGDKNSGVHVLSVRARCFDDKNIAVGDAVSASYVFPKDPDRFTTKVISLVTDPGNLHGSKGILTHHEQRGPESERPISFQFFDITGELLIQQEVGIRVFGTGSRTNDQKNFRIFARKNYTPSTGHMEYPFLVGLTSEESGKIISEFNKLLIRGGASNNTNTMITNMVAQEMMEGSSVMQADFEPTAMFMNGTYYGMMMVLEDYDCYSFEEHYGVSEDQIATMNYGFCDAGLTWHLDDGVSSEFDEWWAVWNYMHTTDFSNEAEYEKISSMIDIDNFIEYTVHNCYINNWDWPRNNQRVWRYTGADGKSYTGKKGVGGYDPDAEIGFDGKWRMVLKDLDVAMGANVTYHDHKLDYRSRLDVGFFDVMRKDRGHKYYDIFKNLMKNPEFCRSFYLYVCEYMSTRASVEEYLDVINRLSLQIGDEMKHHIDYFNEHDGKVAEWDYYLDELRQFAIKRPAIVLQNMKDYIDQYSHGFTIGTIAVADFEGGKIHFNGADFTGESLIYSFVKEDMPIRIIPDPGYAVDQVTVTGGTYNEEEGTLYLRSEEATLTVTFRKTAKDSVPTAPVINEIGHGKVDSVNGYDWIELYNPTDAEININRWILANGADRHILPNITIPAGGFKVLFLAGSENTEGGVYAPFDLNAGDTVTLLDTEENTVESVTVLTLAAGSHMGRYPDGGEWTEMLRYDLTPAAANVNRFDGKHYYDEKVCNAIMINGYLLPSNLVTVTEDGDLTVNFDDIKDLTAIERKIRNKLNDLVIDHDLGQTVSMRQMLELSQDEEVPTVFYVEDLNSYIVHVEYKIECRYVDPKTGPCGQYHE